MQSLGTARMGGGCAWSARRVDPARLCRGRSWAIGRREMAVAARATECPAPRNLKAGGDHARAAVLGSGGMIAATVGLVPVAMATEGLDLTVQSLAGIDIGALISENPNGAALAALGGIFAVKLGAMVVQGKIRKRKTMQPSAIAQLVQSRRGVVVVDVRSKAEKEGGSPDWGQYGKRAVSMPYKRTGETGVGADGAFGKKFARLRGVGRETIVIIVDSDGSQAAAAARDVLKVRDVGYICCIQGGAEAWKTAQMPWRTPAGLKLPAVTVDSIVDSYRANPGPYKLALGAYLVALSAGLLISEADALLEVVGLLGFAQLFLRRMVFAEDRSATMRQLREIRDEKIGVGSAGEDLRRLASAVFGAKKDEGAAVAALAPAVNGASVANGADDVSAQEPVAGTGLDTPPVAMGSAQ